MHFQIQPHLVSVWVVSISIYNLEISSAQIQLVPQVRVKEGLLRGTTQQSRNGRTYFAFLGVRFAEKPKRFQIAQPVQSWNDVQDATKPGEKCKQSMPLMGTSGSEDCLFLNVYTSVQGKINSEVQQHPVLVYIHGGGFALGSSDIFGSNYFLDEDVVLVTINYRLGAFGFLYNEDDQIPGNLGLRDQVLALEWVQRNIENFGGNRDLVTIMGQSAGAACVHLLMLSPLAKGLFHRAIIQSGNAASPWVIQRSPKSYTIRFAAALGCPTENSVEMIDCLRTADADEMAEVLTDTKWSSVPDYRFIAVVESGSNIDSKYAFLSQHPRVLLKNGEIANNVPVIMGVVKNEGAVLLSRTILMDEEATEDLNANWNQIAPYLLLYSNDTFTNTPFLDSISTKIRHFYFGNPPNPVGFETESRFADMFSDCYHNHGMFDSAKQHSKQSPTYLYYYTFTTGFSIINSMGINGFEPPTHGDDIPYLFPFLFMQSLSTPMEVDFSKKLVKVFVSFVYTGKPVATWGPAKEWPMIKPTENSMPVYKLDTETEVVKDLLHYRVSFWDGLMTNELQNISVLH